MATGAEAAATGRRHDVSGVHTGSAQSTKERRLRRTGTPETYDTYTELIRTEGARPIDVPENLKRFVVTRPLDAETLDVPGAADRLGVSPMEVCGWIRGGRLLGWVSENHGQTIPAEQILGPGEVVPGIKEILGIIEDPELAWIFISEEWPFENEVVRPIDKLKVGDVDEVVDSAPGFGAVFT